MERKFTHIFKRKFRNKSGLRMFKEDPFKTCMSINNRYRNLGTEQISKQAKKKQKQKHVAIEGPGAINKLF